MIKQILFAVEDIIFKWISFFNVYMHRVLSDIWIIIHFHRPTFHILIYDNVTCSSLNNQQFSKMYGREFILKNKNKIFDEKKIDYKKIIRKQLIEI